jgi:hypothetical protein
MTWTTSKITSRRRDGEHVDFSLDAPFHRLAFVESFVMRTSVAADILFAAGPKVKQYAETRPVGAQLGVDLARMVPTGSCLVVRREHPVAPGTLPRGRRSRATCPCEATGTEQHRHSLFGSECL